MAGSEVVVFDTSKGATHRPTAPQAGAPIIDIRTMLVTPEQARKWLSTNAQENRAQRDSRIKAYARDMREGKWMLTGEAIKIDTDGVLIDGQHRLAAVIEARVSVYMVVVLNLPHEVMGALDSGLSRTFGDKLKGVSVSNRNQIAAVVRKISSWDSGNRLGKGDTPTHGELMETFERDPAGFTAATLHGMDVYRQKVCGVNAAATAFYLFSRIDTEEALQFFDMLKTGANLPEAHPVLTVRNRLSRAKTARREDRLGPEDQLALLIRAWNAFRENRTLDRIPISREGTLNSRNFPVPL